MVIYIRQGVERSCFQFCKGPKIIFKFQILKLDGTACYSVFPDS